VAKADSHYFGHALELEHHFDEVNQLFDVVFLSIHISFGSTDHYGFTLFKVFQRRQLTSEHFEHFPVLICFPELGLVKRTIKVFKEQFRLNIKDEVLIQL
jgi:hypothetical protein